MEVDERVLLEQDGITDYQELPLEMGISNVNIRVAKAPNLVSNGFFVTLFQLELISSYRCSSLAEFLFKPLLGGNKTST